MKTNNVKVAVHLWNERVAKKLTNNWNNKGIRSMKGNFRREKDKKSLYLICEHFRGWMLKYYWKRKVEKEFYSWYNEKGKHHRDHEAVLVAGKEAVRRAKGCLWWDWDQGSSIFFWRWPVWYQDRAREGHPQMFIGEPPMSKIPQPAYNNESIRSKVKEKIQ